MLELLSMGSCLPGHRCYKDLRHSTVVSEFMRKQSHFLSTIVLIRPSTSTRDPFPLHSSEGSPIPSPIDCYAVTCAIV